MFRAVDSTWTCSDIKNHIINVVQPGPNSNWIRVRSYVNDNTRTQAY